MNYNSTKTMHALRTEVQTNTQMPYSPAPNSTLNEFLDIGLSSPLPTGKFPTLRYLTIGSGGMENVTAGGKGIQRTKTHSIKDASLFEHMPVAMREVGNDFTAEEREQYRLRKKMTRNSVEYFAYFALVGTFVTDEVQTNVITTVDGNSTPSAFDFDIMAIPPVGVSSTVTNKVVSIGVNTTIPISALALTELRNAIDIYYSGDMDMGVINELATVQGIDSEITSPDGVVYTEILGSYCACFSTSSIDVTKISDNGFGFGFFAGNTLPYME